MGQHCVGLEATLSPRTCPHIMIFKNIIIQATIPIACDNESLDYDDEDVIRRLVFDAVREDPTYVARMLSIVSAATKIDNGAEGYSSLSNWAAEVLAEHPGNSLDLRGVKTLSDGAARALATFNGHELLLDGLSELTDAAAESLALHKGLLSLGLLESLSDPAAESLGCHVGRLVIGNLVRLSDNAARALARHRGPLSLSVLLPVSEHAFQTLQARANGDDQLDIDVEPAVAAGAVSQAAGSDERKKVQELLETGTADAAADGLRRFEALLMSGKDCGAVLTQKALRATGAVAAKWLQGDNATLEQYRRYHRLVVRPRFLSLWGEPCRSEGSFFNSGICSVGELTDVHAGSFTMGSPQSEAGRRPDENQVVVRITEPLQIASTPVTLGQWLAVTGAALDRRDDDDCPVTSVAWSDAVLFCELLTSLEQELGVLTASQQYRLPTEAEWEYACRAGTTTAYSFGSGDALASHGWYVENSGTWADEEGEYVAIHSVGLKKPNAWGLYDMHGNVLEWCYDWYSDRLVGGDDPHGPPAGSHRVCRGAYGWSKPEDCRCAARSHSEPDCRGHVGFRVVRSETRPRRP